jgi:hypothetical protein
MKILKEGKPEKPKKHKCKRCNTKFEYTKEDVKPDWREGDYVECPKCKTFINV